ncbi:MAG: hypothetical protein AB1422_16170, partial [bacterium]
VPTELIDLSIYSYRYYVPNGTIILMPYLWVLSYVNFQLITAINNERPEMHKKRKFLSLVNRF